LLAVALLLVALAAAAWLAGELAHGALTWRRTPLDLPLALLAGYVLLQLALGNRALVAWALAPPAPATDVLARFPAPLFTVGTVTPRQTLDSLLIFAGYAAVYLLVVQLVRTRRQLGRLVRVVLMAGGLMAFLALVDYMTGEAWLLAWLRDHPFGGRASGTFVNPDHFAAWLTMLIPLGLGWVTARAGDGRHAPSVRATMSIRALREQAIRRYLPLVGVVVMALALVMTLSRGGIVGLAVGLLALLALLGATGRARRSVLLTGALLVAVAGYGGWIGFGPLLARFSQSQAHGFDRLTQYLASLPMLRDFPIFGAGLGAYRDVYFRYQPLALKPDEVYYPYAHNDLLQLLTELGPPGALLCLFVGWRIVGDLVGPHLLGRGACPVDGGAGEEARRNDRYSVAIAVGALAGVAALVTHSTLDFSARIAANGVLAAVLLGIATVTLHTRLIADQEQLLSAAPALPLARRRGSAIAIGAVAAVLLAGWSAYWVHIGRLRAAEDALRAAPPADKAARAEAVLAVDRRSVAGLRARAAARQTAALAAWMAAPAPGVDRRAAAIAHVAGGRACARRSRCRPRCRSCISIWRGSRPPRPCSTTAPGRRGWRPRSRTPAARPRWRPRTRRSTRPSRGSRTRHRRSGSRPPPRQCGGSPRCWRGSSRSMAGSVSTTPNGSRSCRRRWRTGSSWPRSSRRVRSPPTGASPPTGRPSRSRRRRRRRSPAGCWPGRSLDAATTVRPSPSWSRRSPRSPAAPSSSARSARRSRAGASRRRSITSGPGWRRSSAAAPPSTTGRSTCATRVWSHGCASTAVPISTR
jgi:hypothetical protein